MKKSSLITLCENCPNSDISGPYFPTFGLNTEIYSLNLPIPSKCGKIRSRKNSDFGRFSHSDVTKSIKSQSWIQIDRFLNTVDPRFSYEGTDKFCSI